MKSSAPPTVQCPKCSNQLPGWAQTCQFCGSPIVGVQRPPDAYKYAISDKKSWQEICYKLVAIYWLVIGAAYVTVGLGFVNLGALGFATGQYIMVLDIINVVFSVGLLAELTWAQFLVKILSYLQILGGLLYFVLSFGDRHGHTAILATYHLFTVFLAMFTIYLMTEYGDA